MTTTNKISKNKLHTELAFEQHFVHQLIESQGYVERFDTSYDKATALDKELLIDFIKTTQPAVWKSLESRLGLAAGDSLCNEVSRSLSKNGILTTLRKGIQFTWSQNIKLCHFKPSSNMNPALEKLYSQNILSVMRQVHYSNKNNNSIDVMLFVNGIPVSTLELKNDLTGQTILDAIKQYKFDRKPAGEIVLSPGRVLVHIAVDTNEAMMTTRLSNGKTVFLPLNRGDNGRAGNAEITGEFKTAYFYRTIDDQPALLSREVLLEIIGNLAQDDGGKIIFPRFHQIDSYKRVMLDAKICGAGKNYLIQHSPGSGKTWTISWLAAGLSTLHSEDDSNIFDSVIIISDRRVLDGQLQKSIKKLGIANSRIETIDGTSKQLKDALEKGKKIIVTTIQKFSTETIATMGAMAGKRFAIIIDEAHSSQSGKSAEGMHGKLTDDEMAEMDDLDIISEAIAQSQLKKQPSKNISYFAFTATPKAVTLERFGTKDLDTELPRPFHLYSMRQAVEEGFILDVLQNYTTYNTYFEIEKAIEDDPRFKGAKAAKKVARYVSLSTVNQKAAVIVEHFIKHVKKEINDQAKAMIVCQSREHAYRHFEAIKGYIHDNKYTGLNALIAYSGSLSLDGQTFTEAELNGFSEAKLPDHFDTDQYQVLVVANKYQTGFDQPKLCGMYVDRKLKDLQCVQTLTRLNRTYEGKTASSIHILDFANSVDEIREAFKPYFEVTELEGLTNPEQIYDLKNIIEEAGFIEPDEVIRFSLTYFKPDITTSDRALLEGILNNAVKLYSSAEKVEQDQFRQAVKSYCRFYNFIIQVYPVADIELERWYWYLSWLYKKLSVNRPEDDAELTEDMIRISKIHLKENASESATPDIGDTVALKPISGFGINTIPTDDERIELSKIIEQFNQRHGTNFSEEDVIRFGIQAEKVANDMESIIVNNPPDVSLDTFADNLLDKILEQSQTDRDFDSIISSDGEAWRALAGLLLRHNKRRLEGRM